MPAITTKAFLLAVLSLVSSTLAAPALNSHAEHEHVSYSKKSDSLIKRWHQDPESDSAKLFRRGPTGSPGSAEWQKFYPAPGTTPAVSSIPQAWLDRLYQVTNSSSFPKFGPTQLNGGYPLYANGLKGSDPEVCSFTYECISPLDLVDAPTGVVGLNFDDGPTPFSPPLYDYIEKNNISATHFMIGGNIYYNIDSFQRAERDGGHIAVHTWSHPYMTTLTNEQIVAELGWTSQIVTDLSNGRVPAFWRPPFGDADNRVRMIAQQVFGLKTVPWKHNRDTGDWAISDVKPNPQYTRQSVIATMTGWLTDPARAGYIGLEHEASQADLDVFMAIYPVMIKNNWTVMNVAEANNLWYYVNSEEDDTPIVGPTSIVQTAAVGGLTTYVANQATTTIAASAAANTTAAGSFAASNSTMASTGAASSGAMSASSVSSGSSAGSAASNSAATSRASAVVAATGDATRGSSVGPMFLASIIAVALGVVA